MHGSDTSSDGVLYLYGPVHCRIYMYDTNSSVRMDSLIQDLINSSYVEYSYVQSFHHAGGRPHLYVYKYCLQVRLYTMYTMYIRQCIQYVYSIQCTYSI